MRKLPFDQHPEFMRISRMVNDALVDIASRLDCLDELHQLRPHTDRISDDVTKLMLRAWNINHG